MAVDAQMCKAWREAATRLQIRVIAPFELTLADADVLEVEAFLPDFGGPRGMLAISMEDEARGRRAAAAGLYVSILGLDYRHFDEALFRETLDDWGFSGGA
jgi:hypothetical protein